MLRSVHNGDFEWRVFDLDAGREIPLCIWADDETGNFEAFIPGPNGKPYCDPATDEPARWYGCRRLILVGPGDPLPAIVEAR